MSNIDSPQHQGLDLWLAYQQHKLVIEVIGALEVEAGLREIQISIHHADLVADLAHTLDIAAELAATFPVAADLTPSSEPLTCPPRPANTRAVTPTIPGKLNIEHAEPDTILLEFLQAATSWSPRMRLATRTHPIFAFGDFHDRVQTLVLSAGSARDVASELDPILERGLHRILNRVLGLSPDLDSALDRDLDRNLDHARDLGSHLDRTLDRVRNVTRDLARDLGSEVVRIRALDHPPALELDFVFDHILSLDRALDRSFGQASNYARLGARDLTRCLDRLRALVDDLDRVHSSAGELDRMIQAIVHSHQVLSDVAGVDLQSIDLAGLPLQGLRWSVCTQWPPELEDQIRRDSLEIADGIFRVGRDGTKVSTAEVACE